jgi:hypothetical protein
MAMLVIDTQVYENYGYRWKPKGGSSYKILGVDLNADLAAVVRAAGVERDDEMFREYVLGWHVEADDWLSDFEASQQEYEGEIKYHEPTRQYAPA